jgi:hypothetical protein
MSTRKAMYERNRRVIDTVHNLLYIMKKRRDALS